MNFLFWRALLWIFILTGMAKAYPPAPGMTVHGLIRDEFGWAITDKDAEIVFKQGGTVIARSPIDSEINTTENYRVLLPIDSNKLPEPYREGSLTESDPFTIEVHIKGAVFLPIEILASIQMAGKAGSTRRLDLKLGEDSDADGLPDNWEYWQLQAVGIFQGDENYNLDQFNGTGDRDGDGFTDLQEYAAGTFAFLKDDFVSLKIKREVESGLLEFEYFKIPGKLFVVEGSSNHVDWKVMAVSRVSEIAPSVESWTADDLGFEKLYLPPFEKQGFYRLIIR